MATGKIVFIKPIEYYGFIVDDETHADVFFHSDDVYVEDTGTDSWLKEGEQVEFNTEQAPKGPRATNIERLSGTESAMSTGTESAMSTGTGTVVFFHSEKGYGFIKNDDTSADVFVHMDDVEGPYLNEGERVEFDIEQVSKGPLARNVKRL